MNLIKKHMQIGVLGFISLIYAPAMFGAPSWIPKIPDADNISDGSKSMMTVAGKYVVQGLSLLLFIASVVTFIKFISTIQHGIEEAKKSEGSMVSFGTFAVMGITYMAISIAAAYVGYNIITKFTI